MSSSDHHRRSAVEHIDGPDGGPHTHKCPLVVGYDGGDISHHALTWSLQFASEIGGSVHVVHVIDLADTPVDPDSDSYEEDTEAQAGRERERAVAALDREDVPWTYDAVYGTPGGALESFGRKYNAQMIVLGASGGGFVSVLRRLGGESAADNLARHCGRPVLTVPA
ncbi:universal stress protein [Rhodococcus sp. NPDC079359]|uniref:universal stress protein n=1 Tax=Rhodococcus sp. NPDC079359 TaxID=3154961 RepID=UPI00261D50EA|nr:universal stress protein [Rhodococcus sp. (in: high G+C Gram-positive bacteria)]MDI6628477.1 universal stress protein [Rhodococcus sp. (in: high G+C Gram-positive bacteria)]